MLTHFRIFGISNLNQRSTQNAMCDGNDLAVVTIIFAFATYLLEESCSGWLLIISINKKFFNSKKGRSQRRNDESITNQAFHSATDTSCTSSNNIPNTAHSMHSSSQKQCSFHLQLYFKPTIGTEDNSALVSNY